MIALDTSALVAIIREEEEAHPFLRLVLERKAILGVPTALEFHMVMRSLPAPNAAAIANGLLASPAITMVDFSAGMLVFACDAFDRYGKGRHQAGLNYGDCLAYAVAKAHNVPLLFKGEDFLHTDIRPAYSLPNMTSLPPSLSSFRRIVLKVGSALLVDRQAGRLRQAWLAALAEDIAALKARGADVLVVSSGAIALGRTLLGLPKGALKLDESQAAAAVGQIALARHWSQALAHHGITAGQVLLTLSDTEERRRYLNARATLGRLMEMGAVPVINENDTVATTEIRYGDNDRLAARVATMAEADLLILFSDVDGLYTAPPASDPDARHLPVVPQITQEIEAMAGGAASELSRGGMRTKIEAGKDRHRRRRAHDHRRWPAEKPAGADRRRRALLLVPHALDTRRRAQRPGLPARSNRAA